MNDTATNFPRELSEFDAAGSGAGAERRGPPAAGAPRRRSPSSAGSAASTRSALRHGLRRGRARRGAAVMLAELTACPTPGRSPRWPPRARRVVAARRGRGDRPHPLRRLAAGAAQRLTALSRRRRPRRRRPASGRAPGALRHDAAVERQAGADELLAEGVQVDAAVDGPRHPPGPLQRLGDLRLRLDHLVAGRVADLLLGELDRAPVARGWSGRGWIAVDVAAAGMLGDHVQPAGDEHRADAERAEGPHVDRGLRTLEVEVAQDAGLVGRDLGEDPGERRVGVLDDVDVVRAAQQVGAAPLQFLGGLRPVGEPARSTSGRSAISSSRSPSARQAKLRRSLAASCRIDAAGSPFIARRAT